MRLAMFYGKWSSSNRGGFADFPNLYTSKGLTGSESSFFNLVRGLSERGHQIDVFCDTPKPAKFGDATIYPLSTAVGEYQAYVSWNEPDILRNFKGKRIVAQQLNDFNYCKPGFDDFVDYYISPSKAHANRMLEWGCVSESKVRAISNSINLDLLPTGLERSSNRLIYCSSPDRGLHQALQIFGLARQKKKDLELHVFYEFKNWFDVNINQWNSGNPISDAFGNRARYIAECFSRLGVNGENGLFLHGNVSNKQMQEELAKSTIMLYPCDPVNWTEGFSVSTMDACANGCVPMITGVDALGSIYGESGALLHPVNSPSYLGNWVHNLLWLLQTNLNASREQVTNFAKNFDRKIIAGEWDSFFLEVI